jgi:hypothetical protein
MREETLVKNLLQYKRTLLLRDPVPEAREGAAAERRLRR